MSVLKDIKSFLKDKTPLASIAIAVSGGGDSMALAHGLVKALPKTCAVHLVTVDHGLRPAAKDEAEFVKKIVSQWGENVIHETLTCKTLKGASSKIQEQARAARYDLLYKYCKAHEIQALALGHHLDDQMETFFMRLSGGSGLKGLGCMRALSAYRDLILWRPLLNVSHEDCLSYCKDHDIPWVEDPSNKDEGYERVRWRNLWPHFEAEGLSRARLQQTITRLQGAQEVLEGAFEAAWATYATCKGRLCQINFDAFLSLPMATALDMMRRALVHVGSEKGEAARLQKLENLYCDIMDKQSSFKTKTLGGCLISLSKDRKKLCFEKEGGK